MTRRAAVAVGSLAAVALLLLALACCRGNEAAPEPAAAPAPPPGAAPNGPAVELTTGAELGAAIGKLVRVRGTAQREKLGDSVSLGGGRLVCFDQRFPDDRIGQEVTVEGLLARREDLGATVGPDGAVSQGVAPGTAIWTLAGCALR